MEAGDPGGPVQQEVERGIASLVEQHSAWLELCAAGQKGEEFDWRTAELLSCLRAIEWDLQDLEDAVSIVEGNREKFATLDDEAVRARKEFIDTIRVKIDGVRASVQDSANSDGGHAAAKKGGIASKLGKGYGKLKDDQTEGVGMRSDGQGDAAAVDGRLPGNGRLIADSGDGDADLDGNGRRPRRWWIWCC